MILSRLEKVDLKTVWPHETQNFTPWLAQKGNLDELGNTISMELELQSQETPIGAYKADILCKDSTTQGWVVIENQLHKTDHGHLGQILTYAAGLDHAEGLDTTTVIWIASEFTQDHRAALDWLNEITDERIRFFGLEIELWKIGDSDPAPKFNIICQPNEWTRSIKEAATRSGEFSETKAIQLKYWETFKKFFKEYNTVLRPRKASPQHWLNCSAGRSGFEYAATINTREKRLGAELYISDSKDSFFKLLEQKEKIETEFGNKLDWQELPEAKASRIVLYKTDVDFQNESDWLNQFKWISDALIRLDKVFRPKIGALKKVNEYKNGF